MPIYVGPKYDVFRGDLAAWLEATGEENGELGELEATAAKAVRETAWDDLRRSAHALASVVQVATAQLKEVSATDVLLHQYHVQPVTDRASMEAMGALTAQVRSLRDEVAELRQAVVSLQAPVVEAPRRSTRGKGPKKSAAEKALADLDTPLGDARDEMSDVGEGPA